MESTNVKIADDSIKKGKSFFEDNDDLLMIKNIFRFDIGRILSQDEMDILFREYRENNCISAKYMLVAANQKFVVSIARKLYNRNGSLVDLINEGNIGLMTAIDKYDVDSGKTFSLFAAWYIQREISNFLNKKSE